LPYFNIIKPFWSVLETRVRNRFPPPTSLKQPEDVLKEEWDKIPLETIQNLYEVIPRRIAGVEGKRWSNAILIKKCVYSICSVPIILSNPRMSLLRLTLSILRSDILSTGFIKTI
jgi:hypothetical protein